jgi:hypothetical protein
MRLMRFSGSDWIGDVYEYIGEAIGEIGTSGPLVKKAECIDITSHRAKLPCDLEVIYGVEYQGRYLNNGGDFTGYDLPRKARTTKIYSTGSSTTNPGLIYLDGTPAIFENKLLSFDEREYYLLNPDYIQTSFEEGEIKLHYAGYPMDKYGCPYIMDDVRVETAIVWYCIYNMLLSGYEHPKLRWDIAMQKWEQELPRAQNVGKIPSMGEMERFKKMWVRLIPPTNLPKDFFAGAETSESIAGI